MFDIFRKLTLTGHIFRKKFLFALLMVSFTVQKHLNLIKYHFFIFIFISITLGQRSKKILLRLSESPAYVFF